MGGKCQGTGAPGSGAYDEQGSTFDADACVQPGPPGIMKATDALAPTAELPAEKMAVETPRVRAIETESWRPPEILDEYELRAPIGRGGMGWVWLYWDTLLERDVAVKFVRTLEEEGKAAARFHHPNVATVYRVGEIGGDWRYIASEYIDGENLAEQIPIESRRRVLQIARDLARGLAAAHDLGVVHGDIKPANVMIERFTGVAKLIDFGLARRTRPARLGGEQSGLQPELAPEDMNESLVDATSGQRIFGTIPYLAPELWEGLETSTHSDVYAFGVLLSEACTGRPLHVPGHSIPASSHLDDLARTYGNALASIIGRCLRQQRDERYATGGEVLLALDEIELSDAGWAGNPYRGLLPFEREHRGQFFGRDSDTWRVVELMRAQRLVILVGGSGVGKSSLARAGILAHVADAGIGDRRLFDICAIVPGEHPLLALSRALAGLLRAGDEDDPELENTIRHEMEHDLVAFRRRLRQRNGRTAGTLLFVDQLEELVTLSRPEEVQILARAVGSLIAERTPGVRVLATARSDYLAALAGLPGMGPLVHRAVYLVGPLGRSAMRETIIKPASSAGLQFEPSELVEELVDAVSQAEGGLPVLQFALARLWEVRAERVITREALAAIGGVEGALALHADSVLDALPAKMRTAARHILLEMVTLHRTRARRLQAELTRDEPVRREALEALIRGRLVVTGDVEGEPACEIAHEALVSAWPRFAAWLEEESGIRAIKQRLSRAAKDWDDSGREPDALWGRRFLREVEQLDTEQLGAIEHAFLSASRRAVRRARWRNLVAFGAPIAIIATVSMVLFVRAQALDLRVGELVSVAERALVSARSAHEEFRARRAEVAAALQAAPGAAITRAQRNAAEAAWQHALASEPVATRQFQIARGLLEEAFKLDRGRASLRERLAALLDEQAVFAYERNLHDEQQEILEQLRSYAPDRYAQWSSPATVHVDSEPSGAQVMIVDAQTGHASRSGDRTPCAISLAPGSYVILLESDQQHHEVRYPIHVPPRPIQRHQGRDSERLPPIRVKRPASTDPAARRGYVYVPAGSFMFGYGASNSSEGIRSFYDTVPMHERRTAAFWIAPNEATNAEWIEFLEACAGGACPGIEPALPRTEPNNFGSRIELNKLETGWALTVQQSADYRYTARLGEKLVYTARTRGQREHDWLALPVTGISARDVYQYLAWLDRSERLPGARLCLEDEWERSARGAGTRRFPHGDILSPDQANIDLTYGRVPGSHGGDEVGTHRESASPFGIHDMAGNVWEITQPLFVEERADTDLPSWIQLRGGSNLQPAFVASVANRWITASNHREPDIGFRICVDAE
jgi:formylglycine-generating enzyme required for sulfatase activity/predicted Ser/Thr protein kinase